MSRSPRWNSDTGNNETEHYNRYNPATDSNDKWNPKEQCYERLNPKTGKMEKLTNDKWNPNTRSYGPYHIWNSRYDRFETVGHEISGLLTSLHDLA